MWSTLKAMHALLIHTPWRWPPKTASFWGSWNRTKPSKPTQEFCKDDGDKFGWCCFSDFAVFFWGKWWKDATFCLNVVLVLVFFDCVCGGGGMSSWRRSWARIALERQVCHCSKPQLSSKIGATSLVRSTKVGMMAWLSDHAFVLLHIFDYLFTCKISLVEIDVLLTKGWGAMLILARSMVRNIQPSTFAWQRVAEHSACIKPQMGWRCVKVDDGNESCVSLMGNILAWGCHKTQAFPSNFYANILTWMFVHWLHQLRGHCALKVAIVGGTRFADDANRFIEQRP